MCGIIGYLGNEQCFDFIINGLYQLQNRGYDSVGMMSIKDDKFIIKKEILSISISQDISPRQGIDKLETHRNVFEKCCLGIGHTRWATHGVINVLNCHPHTNSKNTIGLVHNGVIDNYLFLKNFLITKGYHFYSETDTEIIVNLIDYHYTKSNTKESNDNKLSSIQTTMNELEGTFALIISFLDDPNTLFCCKRGSPLLISNNSNMCMITSEESGFNGLVKNYIRVENDNIYQITRSSRSSRSIRSNSEIILKCHGNQEITTEQSNLVIEDLSFEPYNNWTEKEIFKQYESLQQCINYGARIYNESQVKLGGLNDYKDKLKLVDNILLLGCGSSHYSSLLGKFFFRELTNLNIILAINACEFELEDIPKIGKTAIIFISQSGETRDISKILDQVKNLDIITIGLVNTVNSIIANISDCGVYLNVGKEHGVASTKSFTSQSLLLSLIAIFFSQIHDINEIQRINYISDIQNISQLTNNLLTNISEKCKDIAQKLVNSNNLFVIGKNQSEIVALEGSLKIKEITYVHAEGYSASMLKHGPFSLLSEDTFVIVIMPRDKYYKKTYSVLEQIISRKSPIILISNDYIEKVSKEHTIIIPKINKLQSILNIIPLQLISYYLSILRNINPDFPRNLAKVVTVE